MTYSFCKCTYHEEVVIKKIYVCMSVLYMYICIYIYMCMYIYYTLIHYICLGRVQTQAVWSNSSTTTCLWYIALLTTTPWSQIPKRFVPDAHLMWHLLYTADPFNLIFVYYRMQTVVPNLGVHVWSTLISSCHPLAATHQISHSYTLICYFGSDHIQFTIQIAEEDTLFCRIIQVIFLLLKSVPNYFLL